MESSTPRGRGQNEVDDHASRVRPTGFDSRPPSYEQPPDMRGFPNHRGHEYRRDVAHHKPDGWHAAPWDAREGNHRVPVHAERPGIDEPPLLPPPSGTEGVMSNARPIRNRRDHVPDRANVYEGSSYSADINSEADPPRPPARQGLSLLDRLENPPPMSTSLRDRVEGPMKSSLPEFSGLPPRPSMETTHDAEMTAALEGSGRGKIRKRNKRGRRV